MQVNSLIWTHNNINHIASRISQKTKIFITTYQRHIHPHLRHQVLRELQCQNQEHYFFLKQEKTNKFQPNCWKCSKLARGLLQRVLTLKIKQLVSSTSTVPILSPSRCTHVFLRCRFESNRLTGFGKN